MYCHSVFSVLPTTGTSMFFNSLTIFTNAQAAHVPFCTTKPNLGFVQVPNKGFVELPKFPSPKKKCTQLFHL